MNGNPFQCLLGMSEMEWAVERCLKLAKERGIPVSSTGFRPEEFVDGHGLLTGFCQLVAHGWLEPSYPNSTFIFTKGLVDRMRTRACWSDLPYPEGNRLAEMERMARSSPTLAGRLDLRDNKQ